MAQQNMERCIDNCLECYRVCLETITYCLEKGGKHAEAGHIMTLMDCVETCNMSANFMIRGSEMHEKTCGVCAEACRRCAEECEKMADDTQMQKCAEVCRRCAESCEEMASGSSTQAAV